jgi:VanZ family protein
MTAKDLLLGLLVLIVGLLLARKASPLGRVTLFLVSLLVSATLFLPGSELVAVLGKDGVATLKHWAGVTPWTVSGWVHFLVFGLLGALVWIARPDLRGWRAPVLVAVLACSAEIAQGMAPGRSPRWDDVAVNLLGGACGLLLAAVTRAALPRDDVR